MPALRGDPLGRVARGRVPEVDVLELRPEAEVAIREVEDARIERGLQPDIVGVQLGAPGVLADEERLRRASQATVLTGRLAGETSLGLGDEPLGVGREPFPRGGIGEELGERQDAETLDAQGVEHALLRRVERGARIGEPAPGAAIGEQPIVEPVRRAHTP